jgi:hypothetical protein
VCQAEATRSCSPHRRWSICIGKELANSALPVNDSRKLRFVATLSRCAARPSTARTCSPAARRRARGWAARITPSTWRARWGARGSPGSCSAGSWRARAKDSGRRWSAPASTCRGPPTRHGSFVAARPSSSTPRAGWTSSRSRPTSCSASTRPRPSGTRASSNTSGTWTIRLRLLRLRFPRLYHPTAKIHDDDDVPDPVRTSSAAETLTRRLRDLDAAVTDVEREAEQEDADADADE